MRRRSLLAAGGLALSPSAGCLETLERQDAWRELVVDPPEGSYVPPKVDEMAAYGSETVDGRTVSLSASRPHSFWTVTGDERVRADLRDHHAIHLMATVREADTGVVVPASVAVTTSPRSRDAPVDQRTLWPMLSQRMGFHYGDNVPLAEDGSYVASVRIEPTTATVADGLDDRLGTATTAELEFEYAASEIDSLGRRLLDADEGRGEAGAVEPMGGAGHGDHDQRSEGDRGEDLEAVGDAPLGAADSGDLAFGLGVLEDDLESGDPLLAVVPRTRYNRYPVPFASLSVAVRRDGEETMRLSLGEHIDADLGHHYGTRIDRGALDRADELAVRVETPPQVSRHEGYETAFLEFEPATVEVDSE